MASAPFDPLARYVDQETGLEYENFGSYFAGEPLENSRNRAVGQLHKQKYVPHAVKAFWQAYDACEWHKSKNFDNFGVTLYPPSEADRYSAGRRAGEATGCWGRADGSASTSFGTIPPKAIAAWSKSLHDAIAKPSFFSRIRAQQFAAQTAAFPAGKRDDIVDAGRYAYGVITIDTLT